MWIYDGGQGGGGTFSGKSGGPPKIGQILGNILNFLMRPATFWSWESNLSIAHVFSTFWKWKIWSDLGDIKENRVFLKKADRNFQKFSLKIRKNFEKKSFSSFLAAFECAKTHLFWENCKKWPQNIPQQDRQIVVAWKLKSRFFLNFFKFFWATFGPCTPLTFPTWLFYALKTF